MSDQVVFTKEEVDTIRRGLEGSSISCIDALSILDSPRPRPKVTQKLLREIAGGAGGNVEEEAPGSFGQTDENRAAIAHTFGFDAEG